MRRGFNTALFFFLLLTLIPANASGTEAGITITVSGTVTGPSGPAAGVKVHVGSPLDNLETTTAANGSYQVTIETTDRIWINVRPTVAQGLAESNRFIELVTGNTTEDFVLVAGHQLIVRLTDAANQPVDLRGPGPELQLLNMQAPLNHWYDLDWSDQTQQYTAMLPRDIISIHTKFQAPDYYPTTATVDLRSSSQQLTLPLNVNYAYPFVYEPPDAAKITIGTPDDLGEAGIAGAAGAARPLSHVLLVNLHSSHQSDAVSNADGSFSAKIFAPPGSAIMIKHGRAHERWTDLPVGMAEGVNPFPGTIINVAHVHTAGSNQTPFAAAGGIDVHAGDSNQVDKYVGAAWSMSGVIGPTNVDGSWQAESGGLYANTPTPGLYRGGFNWTHPTFGDLDNDKDLDLLIGERSGRLAFYRNDGNVTTPTWNFESLGYAGVAYEWWAYPALGDLNDDDLLDLVVGSGDGNVDIYFNAGTKSTAAWPDDPDQSLYTQSSAAPALFDLDADNDLDLLVGRQDGTLTLFRNRGSVSTPTWSKEPGAYGAISETDQGLQPSFVDLDADGDADLLIGRNGDLVWYRNNGPPQNPTWTRITDGYMGFGASSAISPGIGDWDNDGDDDLAIGEHWGNLSFFRNDGAPTWNRLTLPFPFDLEGGSAPALGDWDNDGDLDLLIGQVHGNIKQYTNIGDANRPDWRPDGTLLSLPWTDHPRPFPTFADIDDDGDLDLFIGEGGWQSESGAGGNIHYYRNDGSAGSPSWKLVSAQFLGLDFGGWSTPVFVDIDDDGDLDLFVGDEDGTLTFVKNRGSKTVAQWSAPIQGYAALFLDDYAAPAFVDVDQDGDLDMMAGLGGGSLAYIRNDGTKQIPSWELVSTRHPDISTSPHSTPAIGDLNGDSRPDLLIGGEDGGLTFFTYQGKGAPIVEGESLMPGDLLKIKATVRAYGTGISAATDVSQIEIGGSLQLMMLFDADGNPRAGEHYFVSTRLTPTGLPIQGDRPARIDFGDGFSARDLRTVGAHAIEGDINLSMFVPDLPPGTYRPVFRLQFKGVPTNKDWLAANVTRYTFQFDEAPVAPISIGAAETPHLIWRLLMDDFVQGIRGAGAREDQEIFGLASQIVTQGPTFFVPPTDPRTGQVIPYRLEPFLPMISYTDRRMPSPPLIPFQFGVGEICVTVQKPDGVTEEMGCEAPAQSFNRTKTTIDGWDLNGGTVQLEDVYSLMAASDRFRTTFDQYGRHIISMHGTVQDIWGNRYNGGGAYDLWIAQPLDIDPGVLPGTPLAAGDAFNPSLQIYPSLPADVDLTITHYPDSDPARKSVHSVQGKANRYGYFDGGQNPIILSDPGEYRVDLVVSHTGEDGAMAMGSMTWGGVVMTPPGQADLIAHGRRGLDSLPAIPNHWFVAGRDLSIPAGAISHSLNPYFNGDILWSRMSDSAVGGDSLIMGASVQDTVGSIESTMQTRASRMQINTSAPGTLSERFAKAEIPLFSSTRSGLPVIWAPEDADQIAYSYRSSQRPGVRVREMVAEDAQSGGYWRLDTQYDDQLSVGVEGDKVNDFKFQYIGAVYRDIESGHSEYLGQGSGWIFIPDDDTTGSRVMPPFAGVGNGGWTTEGGPILTLRGEDVEIFILPSGVQPGAVLEMGDTFHFAGHIMPTLNSKVDVVVTAPDGTAHPGGGQANAIGYFYDPDDNFSVDQPGLWSVDVNVLHDGQCSGGSTVAPYPSGTVLGSENGRYWFYVAPDAAERLHVALPAPGHLRFEGEVTPIMVRGLVPPELQNGKLDYTIQMPGYLLAHGQVRPTDGEYIIPIDFAALQKDFPNLDLVDRDSGGPGLADTINIGLLLYGTDSSGAPVIRANTVTLQGEQVFVRSGPAPTGVGRNEVYLPVVHK